ncbi:MAG: HK97 family phage prohead protease [Firmicutes bacterium]|jgi:HK97 family phage prohead protease|nr:HK97 family phage prohead protease [Bacillota bacterium]
MNIEKRLLNMEIKQNDSNAMIIEGYAITYDEPATHTSGNYTFTEVIKRGALDNADLSDVVLRYNHNDSWCIMARTKNNSLQLIHNDVGLKIQANLIDTQSNRDIYKSIQEGLINKMSFSFTVAEKGDSWSVTKKQSYREIINIDKLYDVSVVDMPFYDTTNVYARSVEKIKQQQNDLLKLQKRKLLLLQK